MPLAEETRHAHTYESYRHNVAVRPALFQTSKKFKFLSLSQFIYKPVFKPIFKNSFFIKMNKRYIKCYAMPHKIKRLILCYTCSSVVVNVVLLVFYLVIHTKSFKFTPASNSDWYSNTLDKLTIQIFKILNIEFQENTLSNTQNFTQDLNKLNLSSNFQNCNLLLSSSNKIILNISIHISSILGVFSHFVLTLGFLESTLIFFSPQKLNKSYLIKLISIGQVFMLVFYVLLVIFGLLLEKQYLVICMVSIVSLLFVGTVSGLSLIMLHHLDEIGKTRFQRNVLQVLEGIEGFEGIQIDGGRGERRKDYVQAINNSL